MEVSSESYLDSLFPADADLERVKEQLRINEMPDISIAPGYGRLLTMLVTMSGAGSVLEIGALGGYSGICLARGLPSDGKMVSLEIREDYAAIAQANLSSAGFADRVQYITGDAKANLERLEIEGARFHFFFIDADKENYPVYLDWCIRLANDGAVIAADNTLLRGRTINPDKQGPSVMAMREFNRRIAQDPRLMGVHLPAYDGLALARVHKKG